MLHGDGATTAGGGGTAGDNGATGGGGGGGTGPPNVPSELQQLLEEFDSDTEDEQLVCIVCKEGLSSGSEQPLGVYVYTKRVHVSQSGGFAWPAEGPAPPTGRST